MSDRPDTPDTPEEPDTPGEPGAPGGAGVPGGAGGTGAPGGSGVPGRATPGGGPEGRPDPAHPEATTTPGSPRPPGTPTTRAPAEPPPQRVAMPRRRFLSNTWRVGGVVIAGAGAWTAWDFLQPGEAEGFGGVVESVPPDTVPDDDVLPVPTARGYLTVVDGEIIALYWKCPHLGCRVPWCASSGRFECPCHGSVFSRAGDYISGPAPRGMDRFGTEEVEGVVAIDTADVIEGRPQGEAVLDEPARGPSCLGGEG